jgi:hypothetical protein
MAKIIIGIHGMRNKPDAALLKKWWIRSIKEGLRLYGYPQLKFKFELVYWAHIMHPDPLDPNIEDPKDPLYMEFPYTPSPNSEHKFPSKIRKKVLDLIEKETDKIFLNSNGNLNFASIADKIIHKFFRDLDIYFNHNCNQREYCDDKAQKIILLQVGKIINKYKQRQIMVIGHSMGSIIAFDALTRKTPFVKIDSLVTAGSPLGLPPIMKKLLIEKDKVGEKRLPTTPETIKNHWYNLSDLTDKIAVNYSLSDDYQPNSFGIGPVDKIVYNDYIFGGKRNPHKSYGYLRTKEMAEIIYEFLSKDKSSWRMWLSRILDKLREKYFIGEEQNIKNQSTIKSSLK